MVQITTIELFNLVRDNEFNVFDFDYDFYTEDSVIRQNFEKKFIENYMFNEIGAETVHRWKLMLRNRLDLIMPKYKELYITRLRCNDIDFMLNKDYTETYEKVINQNLNSTSNSDSNTNSNSNQYYNDNNKESNLNNGLSEVGMDSLTGISESENSTNLNENSNSNMNQNNNSDSNLVEKFTTSGKGNIGVTSSANLLKMWRDVIIDIDKMIIDELYDLFMLVY